ncbi:uncharacterized protein EAF02_004927 [Botrytis sinoallii]|uniref:uncharacterized protein n=1 Tax=Botrytis sinoallii TaxID=1463999 RepID=UPI001901C945|nr:uncharacterized protein EAF02_004927 [Botrytis sinoallii]KAF7884591.1 hypothetical protein EAF02_004927 [Botrytis sinoallii]
MDQSLTVSETPRRTSCWIPFLDNLSTQTQFMNTNFRSLPSTRLSDEPTSLPYLKHKFSKLENYPTSFADVIPPMTRTAWIRTTGSAFDTKLFRAGQGGFEDTYEVQVFMFQYTLTDHECGSWCMLFGKLKTIFHCKYGSNHAVL